MKRILTFLIVAGIIAAAPSDLQAHWPRGTFAGGILEASVIIDTTHTEAFLVRKNADGGDIFTVDTQNENVAIGGQLLIDDGTAGAPGLAFESDPTKGFYSASGSIIGSVGGSGRFRILIDYLDLFKADGPRLRRLTPTNVVPTLNPLGNATALGLGAANALSLSLIADGVEGIRIAGAATPGEVSSVFGGNVVETITDATSAGDATLTKAGENFDVTCSAGDAVLIYGGSTAGDYGLYVIVTVTSPTVLTLDRVLVGGDVDVDFDVIADGVVIENSTDPLITRLRVPGNLYVGDDVLSVNTSTGTIGIGVTPHATRKLSVNGLIRLSQNSDAFTWGSAAATLRGDGGSGNGLYFRGAGNGTMLLEVIQNVQSVLSTGNFDFLNLSQRINQTGTAGYRGIFLNVTETGTGSGAKLLMDLQVDTNSKFTVSNTGETTIDGYTKLGSDAPVIKMKKLTGTSPAVGASATIAHGLNQSKIVGVQALVSNDTGNRIPPNFTSVASHEFDFFIDATNVYIYCIAGNSSSINGNAVVVLITYEE
ncbi:hypothetical protein LCGC14_0412290 [marine sediment metagenome]|uniref:Uncharacterized protein n=1 Tax=marine sediment metagenome TaxID=412755 RepID=A0A0F9W2L5_9ZZZZ